MKLIGVNFEHEKFTELIIYDEIQLKHIRKQYEHIGQKYMGHVKDIIHEMENFKSEIRYLNEKHEKEIAHKNRELTQKNVKLLDANYKNNVNELRQTIKKQQKIIKKLQFSN